MGLHAERMARFGESGLYVVITQAHCAGRDPLDVLDKVLSAGVKLVQLREKELNGRSLYERALAFRDRTARAGALLIVNDRLDIAMAAGADGVHLGLDDLPVTAARKLAADLVIGASTHSLSEALSAQDAGASYVNIGPVFTTQTKSVSTGPVGPKMLDAIRPHLCIPWTTMGGIKPGNIQQVLDRSAGHVAVVTAVTAAEDVRAAASQLDSMIQTARASAKPGSQPS